MAVEGSITPWIARLKAGDPTAAQRLWERFYQRLTGLARRRLRGAARRVADEDDVVVTAFDSFCRGAARGRFPRLADRHDLWQLLVVLTARKATKLAAKERRQKRGGGAVLDEAALAADAGGGDGLDQLAGAAPDPAFAAQVADQLRALLDRLDEPVLRILAVRKLEGYENEEIATELGCALRTVERKLQRIRGLWQSTVSP